MQLDECRVVFAAVNRAKRTRRVSASLGSDIAGSAEKRNVYGIGKRCVDAEEIGGTKRVRGSKRETRERRGEAR